MSTTCRKTEKKSGAAGSTRERHSQHPQSEPPPYPHRHLTCVLGANPFPEVTDPVCRLPLPTLFCRPEAFSLGDLLRLTVRPDARERDLPCFFHAHPPDTLLHEESAAFQDSSPCPRVKRFKGQPFLQKETTASSGAGGYGQQDRQCVTTSDLCIRVAECSRIPFRQSRTSQQAGMWRL